MYYPELIPAGPVVASNWETIGPSHVQYNPEEYIQRAYGWPSEHRGQRFTNPVPYGATPSNGAMAPYGEHPTDQKVGLILLLVGIGILAYYLGRSSSPKVARNPSCPTSWTPRRRRRIAPSLHRARRRRACMQPRDDQGRFLPVED
jgi:hypothetical protein